jgi:hypothetical protein
MMSFFKKETKEDKERKKLEKKLNNSSIINPNNNNNTNLNISSSSYILNNSNNNLIHQQQYNLNESNNQELSIVMNTTNEIMNNKLENNKNGKLTTSSSKLVDTLNGTSFSSSTTASSQGPPLPPKPKKGILKTMSKFGIGPMVTTNTLSNNSHMPTISNSNPSVSNKSNPNNKSIETSIPNYTKRNSQIINDSGTSNDHVIINGSGSLTATSNTSFNLPQIKQAPVYITKSNLDYLNSLHGKLLLRNIQLDQSEISSIQFTYDYDYIKMIPSCNNLDDLPSIPILIKSSNNSLPFLPNDQLISINDQLIIEKSMNEVKNIINDSSNKIIFKVRTSLENSELVIRNKCDTKSSKNKLLVGANLELNQAEINSAKLIKSNQISSSTSSLSSLTSNTSSSASSGGSSSPKLTNSIDNNDLNNVWLIHLNGYTAAKIFAKIIHKNGITNSIDFDSSSQSPALDTLNNHVKFKIRLENGQLIEVNEENLEKANPSPQYDNCEDLSLLRFINESSLIHTLRQRYLTHNLIHTYLNSQTMVIMRPLSTKTTQSIYDDRVLGLFKGCKQEEMPPHIYSYAQSVYKSMLTQRQDQSVLLMGHSGSGKTHNSKYFLQYIFKTATNSSNLIYTEPKLNSIFNLLNAFCSIKTKRNGSANRFLNVFLLEFNNSGQLASILLQTIQFDQTRLINQNDFESNYLILYYLLLGINNNYKNEFQLNNVDMDDLFNDNILFQSKNFSIRNDNYRKCFDLVMESLKILNFDEQEIKSLFSILLAIVYLGKADAIKLNGNNGQRLGQFKSANDAHKAASLLGISFNQLNDCVFTFMNLPNTSSGKYGHLSSHGSSRVSPDPNSSYLPNNLTPLECLQGFCLGLYSECVNLIINCINRSFKSNSNSNNQNGYVYNQSISNSMLIIDPPGFQYQLYENNQSIPCSYSELMCNYLSERLKLMFFQVSFINPIEKCAQEGLDIDLVEHIPESPSALVNWLDKPPAPTSFLNRNNPNSSSSSALSAQNDSNKLSNGLLWILEDQMNSMDAPSSKTFMNKIIESDPKQNFLSTFVNKNEANTNFVIHHQYDQFPIEYNVDKWMEKYNKEFQTQRNALHILQQSKKEHISATFLMSAAMSNAAATLATNNPSSIQQNFDIMTSSTSSSSATCLKRQASVRKMLTLSKRKTFTINFKLQIDSLFDSIRRTKTNFLFCLLPKQEINSSDQDFNVPLLRSQLKAYQLLAACRIYRQGYPEYMNFEDFERRYSMFLNHSNNDSTVVSLSAANNDLHKQTCLSLIKIFDLDQTHFKLGTTQIFFKAGILARLEQQRDERINDFVVKLQSYCKRYLAINAFNNKKTQDLAIRCIQKNIRISFALKKWKWWRLYTNLMPIVNVQSNETMLKQYREEVDELRKKNERLNNEKNELKLLNNQLENKVCLFYVFFSIINPFFLI